MSHQKCLSGLSESISKGKRNKHECEFCGKQFSRRFHLVDHERTHTKEKPFTCEVCEKSFSILSNLVKHKRIHTRERPYQCDICMDTFTRSDTLAKHRRIHTKDKPHECDVCHMKFSQTSNLTKHKRVHTGDRAHQCDICKKAFTRSDTLAKHKKIHTGERSHECDSCERRFSQKSNLVQHKLRIHAGIKDHQCDVSMKRFFESRSLERHKTTHTINRCDICFKMFSRSSNLARHKQTHAVGKICGTDVYKKQLLDKSKLSGHEKMHTDLKTAKDKTSFGANSSQQEDINLLCKSCCSKISFPHDLKEYFVEDTQNEKYLCKKCNKEFFYSIPLLQHIAREHISDGNYRCGLCEELKATEPTGIGYICCICDHVFDVPKDLLDHMVTHHKMQDD